MNVDLLISKGWEGEREWQVRRRLLEDVDWFPYYHAPSFVASDDLAVTSK